MDGGHYCSSVTTCGLRVSARVAGHALKSRHPVRITQFQVTRRG